MGLKSLTLQIIPWFFNIATCHSPAACVLDDDDKAAALVHPHASKPIHVVTPDGHVRTIRSQQTAVQASSLMTSDHPRHLVSRADDFIVGKRANALPPSHCLEPGRAYVLLPMQFFRSAVSFASLAAAFPSGKHAVRSFDVQKLESGEIKIKVSEEFLERGGMDGGLNGRVCTTAALSKDYRSLVRSRSWQPKLETIGEAKEKKRRGGGGGHGSGRRRSNKASSSQ